jgi:hypothetical protein
MTLSSRYRNRNRLDEKLLKSFSRLCNLLLKQGRIYARLHLPTVNLLGSDNEQEMVLKEFKMYDQLAEFYISRLRHAELFQLRVEQGLPEEALGIADDHEVVEIPDEDIINVLHCVRAGRFTSDSHTTIRSLRRPRILLANEDWSVAEHVVSGWSNPENRGKALCIESQLVKRFLYLYVSSDFERMN